MYSLAQDELPEFPDYNVAWTNTYRQEAEIESQKRMWDNGNVQIEYVTLHDSIRLRKGYFESGNIKLTVEVYQQWNYDTVYSENLITGEMTMEVLIEYADILEGNFEGYHNTTRLLIKCLLRSYTGCV